MKLSNFLLAVGRPVIYYPNLARGVGGVKQGILLCQLIHWTGESSDPEGWIHKSIEELQEETGLSDAEQQAARRSLVRAGVLKERSAQLENNLYFRLDFDALEALWSAYSNLIAHKRLQESAKLARVEMEEL